MARPRKNSVENNINNKKNEGVKVMNTENTKPVSILKKIKFDVATPKRKAPVLDPRFIIGNLQPNVYYTFTNEVNSPTFGTFYRLADGSYVHASGNFNIQ